MTLRELYADNYEYLEVVAKRITRAKNVRMAHDLISETYINLASKETEYPKDKDGFVKWFSTCMKNYFEWPNSSFNKLIYSSECLSLDADHKLDESGNLFVDLVIDEDALNDIELGVEETNEATKELIEVSSSLGKDKTLKFIQAIEFKKTLRPHEIILFELYYENELSTRTIAEMYSYGEHRINYQSINKMINIIKLKIKEYQWK